MKFLKLAAHLFIAAFGCAVAAILLHTQMVLAALNNIDISIPMSDRLYMSVQDLLGLLPVYGAIILLGLAIAFSITKLIRKFFTVKPIAIYPIAGAAALFVILISMQPILDITLLAGARSTTGIILQAVAGALGGVLFAVLRQPKSNRRLA